MSRVAKAAVGLMAATLVAKILGFGRELALDQHMEHQELVMHF